MITIGYWSLRLLCPKNVIYPYLYLLVQCLFMEHVLYHDSNICVPSYGIDLLCLATDTFMQCTKQNTCHTAYTLKTLNILNTSFISISKKFGFFANLFNYFISNVANSNPSTNGILLLGVLFTKDEESFKNKKYIYIRGFVFLPEIRILAKTSKDIGTFRVL